MSSIAVVGLGAMGRPIARNLLAAGHEVVVWNRSPEPVAELVADGARAATHLSDAFEAGTVFSVVSNDAAFAELFLDSGVLETVPQGAVHVNLATVSTALAQRAAEAHAAQGIDYAAAPVFGRVAVAEAGALNVLAGGPPEVLDRAQPFFDVIGSRTWRLGDRPEQANIVKILGNFLMACAIQALGESTSVAEGTGVDPSQFIELMSSTLFPGAVYSSYGALIAQRRYLPAGFTTELGRKDVHLALDAAEDRKIVLPIGEVLRGVFDAAIARGHAQDDWASIGELLPRGARDGR
jgi:3-hydroxyisobutyrate dehydrogenase-like beta-hydroxyacid dehydrogenase